MSHIEKLKAARRITDLELFDVIVAAYPERFEAKEEAGDDIWDEVSEFVENDLCAELLQDEAGLREFLGRILLLTHPVGSPLSGKLFHQLPDILAVLQSSDIDGIFARNDRDIVEPLHGDAHAGMPRKQNDRQIGGFFLHVAQGFQTIHAGHAHIHDHNLEHLARL